MSRLFGLFTLIGLVACTPTGSPLPAPSSPVSGPSSSVTPTPQPSGEVWPSPAASGSSTLPIGAPSASVTPLPDASDVRSLRLEAQRFLSASGERVTLRVLDQNGTAIAPERLRFTSSRPQDFSVDALGQVQAQVDNGFSTISVLLLGSVLFSEQLFSVSRAGGSGGGAGGGSSGGAVSGPTQENVSGQVAFQF